MLKIGTILDLVHMISKHFYYDICGGRLPATTNFWKFKKSWHGSLNIDVEGKYFCLPLVHHKLVVGSGLSPATNAFITHLNLKKKIRVGDGQFHPPLLLI